MFGVLLITDELSDAMAVDIAEREAAVVEPLVADGVVDTIASVVAAEPSGDVLCEVAALESLAAGIASGTSVVLSVLGVVGRAHELAVLERAPP